jgi:hypothetical protein
MSIVLYHGGAAANSLKSLLPLFEKKVDFKSHLLRSSTSSNTSRGS